MDDIWGGYYLESLGFKVVYNKATVFQDRNVQNLTKNMIDEYLGYEKTYNLLVDLKKDSNKLFEYLPEKSREILKIYMEKTKKL
jgi:hypothetical protein